MPAGSKDENLLGKLTDKTEAIDKTLEQINEAVPNIEASYKTLEIGRASCRERV